MNEFNVQEIALKKDFDGYKSAMAHYNGEAIRISEKAKQLWQKSAEVETENKRLVSQNKDFVYKLQEANNLARLALEKKNIFEIKVNQLESEKSELLKSAGSLTVLNSHISDLKKTEQNLISEKQALKIEIENLKALNLSNETKFKNLAANEISLNAKIEKFNGIESEKAKALQDLDKLNKTHNALLAEVKVLKTENEKLKTQIGAKIGKMDTFKNLVICLAVLANFLLLGKKFMVLSGEEDWQTYLISYGSVLIFDLTVIFLTMVNRSKEAFWFAAGVFVLTFFQIGKPFFGLSLDIDYFGVNTLYIERIISGGIYSFFFAFLSYFLSTVKTNE